jgi:hypothetical protein
MLQRLSFLVCLALALAAAALPAAEQQNATLVKARGNGQVFLPGGGPGEFKAGTLLATGSRILTAADGSAGLLLQDGSRVNLGANTDLTITELSQDGDKRGSTFQLLKGLFRASVQKLTVASHFEVNTPDAVAAVKGTEYEVEVTDAGTEARVNEGRVWLQDLRRERRVEIGARMGARAERAGGRLAEPRGLSDGELRNLRQWVKESGGGRHSGAYLPADAAKREAWLKLRPEQRAQVRQDLADSMGAEFWDDVLSLRSDERQERWRDRVRSVDERRLAAEGAKVDFALGKTAIDRQGRRVRFDEFLLRPAADQLQFLNYSRRGDRVDTISSINTYNRALPRNLSEARGLNQRLWLQGLANPPQYWVKDAALVAATGGDSFAASTGFYDPFFRGLYWELPVKDVDIRLNIADLRQPRAGGTQVESWVRQDTTSPALPMLGQAAASVPFRSVPGTTNNLPSGTSIAGSNLAWNGPGALPTTTLLDLNGLEAKPGDLAFGFRRSYSGGQTFEMRSYVIDENGEVVNLAGVPPDKLMETFINRKLIASLKQIEFRSNQFKSADGINIVSKLLFLHDISKTQDQL